MWMYPIAIACGNAFVLKPSEQRPVGVAADRRAAAPRPGLPDGVFNVVHGDKEAVDALLDHPDVAAVSFVGSTPIAQYVHETRRPRTASACRRSAARRTTPIVLPDADLDFAADAPRRRRLRLGRAALHGDLRRRRRRRRPATRWSRRSSASARRRQGRPGRRARLARWARSSPAPARDRIVGLHRDRRRARAPSCVVDGRGLSVDGHEDGFFVGPTLFDRVTPGDGDLPRGDLRPGARSCCGPTASTRRIDADQRQPVRQRHGDLHRRRRRRARRSSARSRSA